MGGHAYGDITAPSRPLNTDRMAMLPRGEVARVAHGALAEVQGESPELLLLGAALLFATLCQRCGQEPDVLHRMALKVLKPEPCDRRTNDSLQSLRDFAGIRVMGERDVGIS